MEEAEHSAPSAADQVAAWESLEHQRPFSDGVELADVEGPVYRHRVRYHETDAQQVVFNSRYLEFTDVAMTEYFRARGWPWRQLVALGCDPLVVSARIDFKRPALFDDVLFVFVRTAEVGESSFQLHFSIRREADDAELAVVESVYVNVDPATSRSRPLPEEVRARMLAHQAGDPNDQ